MGRRGQYLRLAAIASCGLAGTIITMSLRYHYHGDISIGGVICTIAMTLAVGHFLTMAYRSK